MSNGALTADDNIVEYLTRYENKSLLRFITCGSVDDGKSTLIGRLLFDTQLLFEDQLDTLEKDSTKSGTQGNDIDFALLVDGLAAEREQGITIDVAYRFFATEKRKFIVADTPGHEQYTRNMATGASTADMAILMIDARKGVLTQTKRHSFIVSSLGIRKFVLCINKMDLVDYDQTVYNDILVEFRRFATQLGTNLDIQGIPVSALKGDNIITNSTDTPWYDGPSLIGHLENVTVDDDRVKKAFRMPVQWVNRPNLDFRGFSGQIISGQVRVGDSVRVLPGGQTSRVQDIVTMDSNLPRAISGQSVTLTLEEEIDCSRGDVIAAADSPPEVADQFQVRLLWMSDQPFLPGRKYLLKTGSGTVSATINKPKHAVDVNTLAKTPTKTLGLNEIGVTTLSCDRPIAFDPYNEVKGMGGFILIDRLSNDTVGMGMINFALRRSNNIHWQAMEVDRFALAELKSQKPLVIWFTGLSGAGKSTIADQLQRKLHAMGKHTFSLDGDNVRHGLNRDLGFAPADRVENIRRVAHVARLMTDAGLIVLVSFISPFRSERQMARNLMEDTEFLEVFIDTPLDVAEARDAKGLYAKARAGQLKNFTGIDSPYEAPLSPDIHIKTTEISIEDAADKIIKRLTES